MSDKKYLTVTALTKYIKHQLENDTNLKTIFLRGEISNLVRHSRGHFYFSLKDEGAQIRGIMFASNVDRLNFRPKDGDKVLVTGSISLYEPSGSYSLNVWQMEPDGIGALYLAFEKLKEELGKKGYFSEEHKKALPKYPKAIGVVTSPTGAAIQDIINTISRRYPLAKLILYPALVQGENAKYSITKQINRANEECLVDVLIVGRGGGSIEDLWAFNEEMVAMAIYNSKIPVISAVGHETDFTIADFISDLRAPTPTGAAEMATPDINNLIAYVKQTTNHLNKNINDILLNKQKSLVFLEQRLMNQNPSKKLLDTKDKYNKFVYDLNRNFKLNIEYKKYELNSKVNLLKRIDLLKLKEEKEKQVLDINTKLNSNFNKLLELKKQNLDLKMSSLNHLNPLKLMMQGYSITEVDGKRITSIKDIKEKEHIVTTLKDGKIISEVVKKEEHK